MCQRRWALHATQIDAIEEHGEISAVDLELHGIFGRTRPAEAALLEALVVDHETAAVPEEDLHAIVGTAEEDEEMPGERVLLPLLANEREEAIVPHTHVDRSGRDEDANAPRQAQHRDASAAASSAT